MKEQLEKIRQEALGALESVKDAGELDALRVRFLGKKGELTGVLKTMGKLSAEERPVMGQAANNVRAAIEEKIGKLERYFLPDTEIIVTLSVQKDKQKIEVTIPVKGNIIRAKESSSDMYVSIDLVEEIIERQLRKYKNKLIDQKQSAQAFSDLFISEDVEAEDEIQIVKTKRFAMKPMDPEEACVQMELLGHNFYVFLNAETEEVNVVYKRKGQTYGLIEPEF